MTVAPADARPTPAPTDLPNQPVPLRGPSSRMRLLPVPPSAPAYDDERGDDERGDDEPEASRRPGEAAEGTPGSVVQGALALAFALPGGLPVVPEPARTLRVVPDRDDDDEDPEFLPRPTPRAVLPDPRTWAARLVQALVEVVTGERPKAQLVRWTSTEVCEQLDLRVRQLAAQGAPGARRAPRWRVRSIHVSEPTDGAAEVCALVSRPGRHAALALRLDGVDGRWRCTALELGW